MVASFGGLLLLPFIKWLIALRSIIVTGTSTIKVKIINYLLFILYLVLATVLLSFTFAFFGIVKSIESKFDWVYYGILFAGVIAIGMIYDKKEKIQKTQNTKSNNL